MIPVLEELIINPDVKKIMKNQPIIDLGTNFILILFFLVIISFHKTLTKYVEEVE